VTELSAKQGVLLLAQLCLGICAAAHSVYSIPDHEFLHARIPLQPRGDSIDLRKCLQRKLVRHCLADLQYAATIIMEDAGNIANIIAAATPVL
jgi:hypothetical protein